MSLSRLELCGAVLLAKLYKSVRGALKLKIDSAKFWTDSMIVLGWIRSSPQRKEIFVANRIAEIQRTTEAENWTYVPTKQNPADFVSRGQFPANFVSNEMWKNGPDWLKSLETAWPNCEPEIQNVEEENSMITLTIKTKESSTIWNRFTSFTKLLRFVAYSLRFVKNARKFDRVSGPLSTVELSRAWERIVTLFQNEEFSEEISSLTKNKKVSNKSKIKSLKPFLENDILRVGGRIKNSGQNNDKIHPVLIPKKHKVTELIIRDQHIKLMHAGANATLCTVRKRYWIVDRRAEIRRILHSCAPCFRAKPKDVTYLMGNLPKVRVTAARLFENSGVDYCGPFFIKEKALRNRNKIKAYVFVCLSTRAVHLELVGDSTTASFLGCLRRFFARRGKAKIMYSDNGKNFVGANNELKELYGFLNSKEFNETTIKYCINEGIEWHFSPPNTPHFGGVWEAAVKSLKHHMKRTLRDTLFSFEVMCTYLSEIEAILNSRPLTPMSADPNDLQALTAGHFLIGQSFNSIPSYDVSLINANRLSSWQHVQKLRQDLWKRWSAEYLTEMNVRSKWNTGQAEIVKRNTLVVIRDDNLPPLR